MQIWLPLQKPTQCDLKEKIRCQIPHHPLQNDGKRISIAQNKPLVLAVQKSVLLIGAAIPDEMYADKSVPASFLFLTKNNIITDAMLIKPSPASVNFVKKTSIHSV